ncbi:MAG: hypothetical protein JWO45_781 [Spartobacteria bacterium]|nr:hypothetical protein [Spartobacteria bacterium]
MARQPFSKSELAILYLKEMQIVNCGLRILNCSLLLAFSAASAQESPTASPTPAIVASPSAFSTPVRNVPISFLPPPLEGTISLGVYDSDEKLIRILHQEATLDEFTVGADALVTKWDGKDENGYNAPPGKYHARGYVVGSLKVEDLGKDATSSPSAAGNDKTQIKLMSNPLIKSERASLDLSVGFDDENTFLKTADDLPLFTISNHGNVARASITKNGERSVDVWQDDGTGPEHFRVSNADKIMAFDCGDFELK